VPSDTRSHAMNNIITNSPIIKIQGEAPAGEDQFVVYRGCRLSSLSATSFSPNLRSSFVSGKCVTGSTPMSS
jgi:hypothetical protein